MLIKVDDKIRNKTWSSVSNSSLSKTFALCQFRKLGSKNRVGSEKNLGPKKNFGLKVFFVVVLVILVTWTPSHLNSAKSPWVVYPSKEYYIPTKILLELCTAIQHLFTSQKLSWRQQKKCVLNFEITFTVRPKRPVKKYMPKARARNQPIS